MKISKELTRMGRRMGSGGTSGKTMLNTKVIGSKARLMGLALTDGQTEGNSQESGSIAKSEALGCIHGLMAAV